MGAINPFINETQDYKRNVDILGGYIYQTARFLHQSHPEIPYEQCIAYVKKTMKPGGINELKDPRVQTVAQRKRGTREVEVVRLSEYLSEIAKEQELILTPALIAYQQPQKVKSLLSKFIFTNVNLRNTFKKAKFNYETEGNKFLATKYNLLQSAVKELNNSLSGAGISKYNAVYCKTSHLSLTSGCRTATSYANASNEKFLAGNRHYYSGTVVLQDLLNAIEYSPHDEIANVLKKYNLNVPTNEQVLECITKSSMKYWRDSKRLKEIKKFIATMSDTAKAAFCYVGDLYHLSRFNPGFVESFFEDFLAINKVYNDGEYATEDYLKTLDADKIATIALFKSELMKGRKFGELKDKHPEVYLQVNTTACSFENRINHYSDLISALWKPRYLIPGVAKFRSIVREAVLTSDTDSTIFTTMYWTKLATGSYNFSEKSYNVGYLTVYLASQIVSHLLSMLCANMGVSPEYLRMLQMKNEYYFPIYGLTNISKHYFALRSAQEGVVKPVPELEIKGVQLITSKASAQFMDRCHDYIQTHVLTAIMNDETHGWKYYLQQPLEEELKVRKNINEGGVDYYSIEQIKDPESYKQGEDNATYFQYLLWKRVFAFKYGNVDKPPYASFKIPVSLDKPSKVKRYLAYLDNHDPEMANRLRDVLKEFEKTQFTSLLVPEQLITEIGLPKEIVAIVDEGRAVSQIMRPYYIVLQTLGVYSGNAKNTRLLTDQFLDVEE